MVGTMVYFGAIIYTLMRISNKNPGIFFMVLIGLLILISCHPEQKRFPKEGFVSLPLMYAEGFKIYQKDDTYLLEVNTSRGPNSGVLTYLVSDKIAEEQDIYPDNIIKIDPKGKKVILTETTQIPHLVLLKAENHLIGFPNLDLVSSPEIRSLIPSGSIEDLGSGPSANIERVIDAAPDWMMVSTFGEGLKNADLLSKAGVPVVVSNEYMETHPLGRAEWIKLTGVLLGKLDMADSIFDAISGNYEQVTKRTKSLPMEARPTVLSGNMYRDVWFAPGGDSWMNQLIYDAGGNYLFKSIPGSGSLELNFEFVYDQAQDADFWIGVADYSKLDQLRDADPRYVSLKPFQEKNVYTYTLKKGAKGGLLYFEEGYMRPDWVLLDLLKIIHPSMAEDHQFKYYTPLHE